MKITEEQLQRLKREIVRLEKACEIMDADSVKDHAYNASIIAFHMTDFFFKDFKPDVDFRNWRDSIVKDNKCLQVVHDVCTAAKHVDVSKRQSNYDLGTVRASASYTGPVQSREFLQNYERLEPKIGRNVNLGIMLNSCAALWLDLINENTK
jgi:hypothetical protein